MTKPSLILLAHAPEARARADEIAQALKALGFRVESLPDARKARAASIDAAHRLVLLWSREAARLSALRVVAKLALAKGKLTCVRLDAAMPPAPLGANSLPLPRGRHAAATWTRVLERKPMSSAVIKSSAVHNAGAGRLAGAFVAAVMALVVASALYAVDAGFATRINALLDAAQAQAASLAGG